MSYDVADIDGAHGIALHGFFGGADNGMSIQISGLVRDGGNARYRYVHLTVDEARSVARQLRRWVRRTARRERRRRR